MTENIFVDYEALTLDLEVFPYTNDDVLRFKSLEKLELAISNFHKEMSEFVERTNIIDENIVEQCCFPRHNEDDNY